MSDNKFVKTKNTNKKASNGKPNRIGLIILCTIYVFVMVAIIFSVSKRGYTDKSVDLFVYDDFEVFSEEQEMQLNNNCKAIQQKYGVNVYISTCERFCIYSSWSSNSDTYYYYSYNMDNYYADKNGDNFRYDHNFDYDDNLVVIIINCHGKSETERDDYHFDIYTFGTAKNKITDSEADKIIWSKAGDEIVLASTNEEVKSAVIKMTKDLGVAYSWILSYRWPVIFIITALVGALISWAVIAGVKKSYSKKRDNNSYSFSANSKLNLTVREDTFSHKNVTSVRIERNTPSVGGGFRSSGGGGGGGHRGGR